jgi:DMSO/TMAO reductase YedYZ molybdopterin-dependent catalytic subunit
VRAKEIGRISWKTLGGLPHTRVVADIHCVTAWSRFDRAWGGVTVDEILKAVGVEQLPTQYVLARSADNYSTNVPFEELSSGRGIIATQYNGKPLSAEHGGPARLLVPRLYLWKSAKWITGLQFTEVNEPGFWESRGYYMRGDPFQEERYSSR